MVNKTDVYTSPLRYEKREDCCIASTFTEGEHDTDCDHNPANRHFLGEVAVNIIPWEDKPEPAWVFNYPH